MNTGKKKLKHRIWAAALSLGLMLTGILGYSRGGFVSAEGETNPTVVFGVYMDVADGGTVEYRLNNSDAFAPVPLTKVDNPENGLDLYMYSMSYQTETCDGLEIKLTPKSGYELFQYTGILPAAAQSTFTLDPASLAGDEYNVIVYFSPENGGAQDPVNPIAPAALGDPRTITIEFDNRTSAYVSGDGNGAVFISGAADPSGAAFDEICDPQLLTDYSAAITGITDNSGTMVSGEKLKYTLTVTTDIYMLIEEVPAGKTLSVNGADVPIDETNRLTPTWYKLDMPTEDGGNNSYVISFPDAAPAPGPTPTPVSAYTLTFNGVECAVTSSNTVFTMPENFDFTTIAVAVKKLDSTAYDPTLFAPGKIVDAGGIDAFTITKTASGSDVLIKVVFDGTNTANTNGYPSFETPQITLKKTQAATKTDVTVTSPSKPDFLTSQSTTLQFTAAGGSAGTITGYAGDKTVQLTAPSGVSFTQISPQNVSAEGVTVDLATGKITVNTPYYNNFVVNVKLSDGTQGNVTIKLEAIEISLDPTTATATKHGTSVTSAAYPAANVGKANLVATYYHPASEGADAYEMVAQITYADGTKETKIVSSYGGATCAGDANLRGADYIVWSGASTSDAPKSVSVTAVRKGALSGSTFGGCTFGAGPGVVWNK